MFAMLKRVEAQNFFQTGTAKLAASGFNEQKVFLCVWFCLIWRGVNGVEREENPEGFTKTKTGSLVFEQQSNQK